MNFEAAYYGMACTNLLNKIKWLNESERMNEYKSSKIIKCLCFFIFAFCPVLTVMWEFAFASEKWGAQFYNSFVQNSFLVQTVQNNSYRLRLAETVSKSKSPSFMDSSVFLENSVNNLQEHRFRYFIFLCNVKSLHNHYCAHNALLKQIKWQRIQKVGGGGKLGEKVPGIFFKLTTLYDAVPFMP